MLLLLLDTKLEIKSQVDHHMTYLTSIHIEGQALKALMKERKDLIQVQIYSNDCHANPALRICINSFCNINRK
jgi:hypothetical protein